MLALTSADSEESCSFDEVACSVFIAIDVGYALLDWGNGLWTEESRPETETETSDMRVCALPAGGYDCGMKYCL